MTILHTTFPYKIILFVSVPKYQTYNINNLRKSPTNVLIDFLHLLFFFKAMYPFSPFSIKINVSHKMGTTRWYYSNVWVNEYVFVHAALFLTMIIIYDAGECWANAAICVWCGDNEDKDDFGVFCVLTTLTHCGSLATTPMMKTVTDDNTDDMVEDNSWLAN